MKRSNFIFESVLLGITALLGLASLAGKGEAYILLLLWMIFLGTAQVIHSFILAVNYWAIERTRFLLIIYWIGSAIDLLLLTSGYRLNVTETALMTYIPFTLAVVCWFITFDGLNHKNPEHVTETIHKEP